MKVNNPKIPIMDIKLTVPVIAALPVQLAVSQTGIVAVSATRKPNLFSLRALSASAAMK